MNLVLTRPYEDSMELKRKIESCGNVSCFIQPVMDIVMIKKPLDIADDAIIAISSINGIKALAHNTAQRNFRIITVGGQSARAARRLGFTRVESAVSENVSASEANMVKYIKENVPAGAAINHISADITKGGLKKALKQTGHRYNREILYHSKPVDFTEEFIERLRDGQFDSYSFFSPRSAALFARQLYDNGLMMFVDRSLAFCFSENVIFGLAGVNFKKIYIPEVTNSENFVNLICDISSL